MALVPSPCTPGSETSWPSDPDTRPKANCSQADRPRNPAIREIQRNDYGSDASYSSHDARHRAKADSSQVAPAKARINAAPKSAQAPDQALRRAEDRFFGICDSEEEDYECADSDLDEPHPNWIVAHTGQKKTSKLQKVSSSSGSKGSPNEFILRAQDLTCADNFFNNSDNREAMTQRVKQLSAEFTSTRISLTKEIHFIPKASLAPSLRW